MIFAWMIVLIALSIGFVVLPLAKMSHSLPARQDSTPAVLVDQLEEVKRDQDRGLISASEATAAQQEIKRRILAAARRATSEPMLDYTSGRSALLLAAIFVPLLAIGYYASMGSPNVASLAFVDRQDERIEQRKIAELTEKLYERLITDPEGGASEGWMLLGQTYYRMGEYTQAAAAFETVSKRDDATSTTFSMMAEALIRKEKGIVTPKAISAIDRSIELNPENPAGAFYKAMAMVQLGEEAEAHALLVSHLDSADGFKPWMEAFVEQANDIAKTAGKAPISLADYAPALNGGTGPSADDVAAASEMSAEERGDFIRAMVNRLAERLEESPDDLDGWLRLANAYTVLGEQKNAIAAYESASRLLSGFAASDPRHKIVEQALYALRE
ncbi:cytochrome c-type biogenesis protein CcmI [Nereida ignava]|uniref:Cytochrome c-type biogenesis protein CcmI n=1 Tax=Nereida ignava TaxID=282199 RepID=A0A0U1NJ56_9RHOB|nr:c-type cytochrome biogenesis protein CcmI [Nereida ignava]CRK74776.1 cytochrome c-type biogenesis protein CcmI [Nereida ignava]SFJ87510.1 cytochrome c-type biogenesis protein CcmH [Nereida ignava DSM 16309]